MEEIKKIEVAGQQYGVADMLMRSVMGGNAQVIAWSHTHNMNDYKDAGTYRIKGERTGNPLDDNLPIMNSGSGHTIEGILHVFDSSLTTGSGKEDDCTVTQFLILSNRVGGQEGDMYMRSGFGATKNSLNWKPWEKYQTNVEVGVVSDDYEHSPTTGEPISDKGMNGLVDSGIYSGIYISDDTETFAMLVINGYALASLSESPKIVTQIKYGLSYEGSLSVKSRSAVYDEQVHRWSWSSWNSIGSGGFPENWSVGGGNIIIGTSGGSNEEGAAINSGVQIGTSTRISRSVIIGASVEIAPRVRIGKEHSFNSNTVIIGTNWDDNDTSDHSVCIGTGVVIGGEYSNKVILGTHGELYNGPDTDALKNALCIYGAGDKIVLKYNGKTAELQLT